MTRERTLRRRKQLQTIWAAQEKICFLCGEKLYPVSRKNPTHGWTAEHVRPQCKGHTRTRNILVAHVSCNQRKGDRDPTACELLLLDAVNERLTIWEGEA